MTQIFCSVGILLLALLLAIHVMSFVGASAIDRIEYNIRSGGVVDPPVGVDATHLRLKYPVGGCANPNTGDLFLCDNDEQSTPSKGFNRIFKVDAITNEATVYAGNGLDQTGSGDGLEAVYAGLKPLTCTCDTSGNLYILDQFSNSIRMVEEATHIISLFVDGASFEGPTSLASDDNNIYVADKTTIKKIDKITKAVTVIAGGGQSDADGTATSLSITNATGVDVGSDGAVYFSDTAKAVVRKIVNGNVVTVAGISGTACSTSSGACGDNGSAASAKLFEPTFVHVKTDGTLVIADKGRFRQVISGTISTLAGTGTDDVSKTGGTDGDGNIGTSVIIQSSKNNKQSVHCLFGFNNVVYFNDKFARRYRKIDAGVVEHAFGGSVSSNLHLGGSKLINSYFGPSPISIATVFPPVGGGTNTPGFDIFIATNNGVFTASHEDVNIGGPLVRIVGGEAGNYSNNVTGLHAQLGNDLQIAVNSNKDVYISDRQYHCIRKYDKETKMITIIVGTGANRGADDKMIEGPGNTVVLSSPSICLDQDENLIIVDKFVGDNPFDTGYGYIGKWDKTTGQVTRLVGNFNGDSSTPLGHSISGGPQACVVKNNGDMYWSVPGYIYSLSTQNPVVEKYIGDGECNEQSGCGDEQSNVLSTKLASNIPAMVYDKDRSTLVWTEIHSTYTGIRKSSSAEFSVTSLTGKQGVGPSSGDGAFNGEFIQVSNARLNPTTLALGPTYQGNQGYYTTDGSNQGFIRFVAGDVIFSVSGHYNKDEDEIYYSGEVNREQYLCNPTSIVVPDMIFGISCKDNAVTYNSTAYSYSHIMEIGTGNGRTIAGNYRQTNEGAGIIATETPVVSYKSQSGLFYPLGVAMNSDHFVYYADSLFHVIRKVEYFTSQFPLSTIVMGTGTACADSTTNCGDNDSDATQATLNTPTGIFIRNNVVYIADTLNHKIRKLDGTKASTIIGSGVACATAGADSCDDTDPTKVKLKNPSNIYVTTSGDVYITDAGNSKIRKLSNGVMSVVAGSSSSCSDFTNCGHDVAPRSAKLLNPMGIFVDEWNNDVYISDQTSTIRKISQTNNTITTIAGTFGKKLFSDSAYAIYYNSPTGIVQHENSILVADTGNGMVRGINIVCPNGWTGLSCDIPICYGVVATAEGICTNKQGSCVSAEQCVCNSGFTGTQCETSVCFGILQTDDSVCNYRNGTCVGGVCTCNNGFIGSQCDIPACNGISSSNSSVCNGKGTCISAVCNCTVGYSGSNCEIGPPPPTCFGISANTVGVCSGNGICSALDTCTCESGYSGAYCNITNNNNNNNNGNNGGNNTETVIQCFGVNATDLSVCSGHGSCVAPDQCSCQQTWTGSNCSISTSNNLNNNTGNNTTNNNETVVTTCFGLSASDALVCNGHGNCSALDSCVCTSGYSGANCNITNNNNNGNNNGNSNTTNNNETVVTTCFGLSASNALVCSGNGNCSALDTCVCASGYSGAYCNITNNNNGNNNANNNTETVFKCFGVNATDLSVCSGHGSCVAQDQCSCQQSWSGVSCNVSVTNNNGNNTSNNETTTITCFGISYSAVGVCSGHGNCSALDTCVCASGYSGANCNITNNNGNNNNTENVITCFGTRANESSVCSGHGSCISQDQCSCQQSWSGSNCNTSTNNNNGNNQNVIICFNLMSNDSNVCSGHGSCISQDQCSCQPSWTGSNCSISTSNNFNNNTSNNNTNNNNETVTTCFGVPDYDDLVCSGNGHCSALDTCVCESGYSGANCNITNNNNNNGNNNNTNNNEIVVTCFGLSASDALVCSGHGSCSSLDTCTCESGYSGPDCKITNNNGNNNNNTETVIKCFSVNATDLSVCSGHGSCVSENNCSCTVGWTGDICNTTVNTPTITCYGIIDSSAQVCSGHGSCVSQDQCSCQQSWKGSNCDVANIVQITCYGIISNDSSVCSGHGSCVSENNCSCIAGWKGDNCNTKITPPTITCFGVLDSNAQVCSGHGSCVSQDQCTCQKTWSGSNCNMTTCGGISSIESSVCNGNGQCSAFDTCVCNSGWFGNNCNDTITSLTCFGIVANSSQVCGGHGSCIAQDKCSCNSTEWIGSDCSDEVPQIKISGSENVYVQIDRVPIIVKQFLTCSQCDMNSSLPYVSVEWKQVSGPSVSFSKLSTNDLKITSFSDQTAQQYVFEVSSTYKKIVSKATVNIITQEPDFSIVLYQSSVNSTHVTVGVEISPETMLSKLLTSTWTWTCKNSDLATNCNQSILDSLSTFGSQRSTLFTLAASSSNSIRLSLQIKNTVSSLDVTFPQDATVPIINLLSVSPQKTIVTTSEKLSLQLMVSVNGKSDGIESLISRVWKLNGKALTSPVLSSPSDSSKSNLVNIDISKLPEGSSNNLTCTITSTVSKLSTVFTYSFSVAVNPKVCQCFSSPTSGVALDTQFVLKCINCEVTADTSIQFGFIDSKTKLLVPLSKSISTQLTTPLPFTGSTVLPIQITIANTKTKAKVDQFLNVTLSLPKAATADDIKKLKTTWDNSYKTLMSYDPKKVVYGYITSTVNAMTAALPKTRSILDGTCLNGGTYISETKTCNCTEGFKKNDCSMPLSEWLDLVNDRWITAQMIYAEFNSVNQLESQSDTKLSIQSSILYHLMEKYDEISPQQFEQGFDIFRQQIQDTKSDSYLSIPTSVSDAMSSTLGLLQKSQLSIDGKKSDVFEQVVMSCLTDLGSIKFRDQPVDESVTFESSTYTLTTSKIYPTELSNKKVGSVLQFPDLMTNYLTSYDVRKPLNVRVWKQSVQSISNETVQTVDGIEITTTFTPVDYTLSLDFGSSGQILNIPEQDKVISYLFPYTKVSTSTTTQPLSIQSMIKETSVSSEMICLSSNSSCTLEQVSTNLFACKCSQVSYVSIAERKTTRVKYTEVAQPPKGISDLFWILWAFLILGFIITIFAVMVIVVKCMEKRINSHTAHEPKKNVEMDTQTLV